MKFGQVLSLAFAVAVAANAAELLPGLAPTTNIDPNEYPRILPDNRVVFRFKAPQAVSVAFHTDKVYAAARDADGVWTCTTDPQVPGFHYYWLVIDGAQVADPASSTFYGTGRDTSGIEIPEPNGDGNYYAQQDVPRGEVREHWYHSKVTNAWRRFYIYTPPGYEGAGNTRFPVLYLQHGSGEDERAWVTQGRAGTILDNLIAAGMAVPMLVVMDQGYARRPGEHEAPMKLPPSGADTNLVLNEFVHRFSAFEDVVLQDVIPMVDATYRTIPDRTHRAIAGFSMGGMQAFLIGLRHVDTFASIGGLSGAGGGFGGGAIDPKTYMGGILADPMKFNAGMRLIFLGIGTAEPDRIHNSVVGYHDALTAAGIRHVYYESPGTAHEWLTERRNLRELATHLFK